LGDLLNQNIFFGRMKPLAPGAEQNAWNSRLAQKGGIRPKALCAEPHLGAENLLGGSHQCPHDARRGRRFQSQRRIAYFELDSKSLVRCRKLGENLLKLALEGLRVLSSWPPEIVEAWTEPPPSEG